jgi:hypothetical protein
MVVCQESLRTSQNRSFTRRARRSRCNASLKKKSAIAFAAFQLYFLVDQGYGDNHVPADRSLPHVDPNG